MEERRTRSMVSLDDSVLHTYASERLLRAGQRVSASQQLRGTAVSEAPTVVDG